MTASLALRTEFSKLARERGDLLASDGRVTLAPGGPHSIGADVLDDDGRKAVTIDRVDHGDATEFVAACDCGQSPGEPCAHVWAVLVVSERKGRLASRPGAPLLTRNSAFLTRRARGGKPPLAQEPASTSADSAATFLDRVGHELRRTTEAGASTTLWADRSLLYVIDGPATSTSGATTLTVFEQRRPKGVAASKPAPAELTGGDIDTAHPTDRRLLAFLLGATRRTAPGAASRSLDPLPNTFTLPDALAREVLPLIARTARLWLKPASAASDLVPLAWDAGNAWAFQLDVTDTEQAYHIDGHLERDDVTLRLDATHLAVASEFIVIRHALARLDPSRRLPFFDALKRMGPVDIPKSHTRELVTALAACDVPEERMPEALRVRRTQVIPRPRLSMRRPQHDTGGWLYANLAFDYDGTVVPAETPDAAVVDAERRRIVEREWRAESEAAGRLAALGLRAADRGDDHTVEVPEQRFTAIVRTLVEEGWLVDAEGVRYRAPKRVRVSVTSAVDWFEVSAIVPFDDDYSEDLARVLAALEPGRPMVRLDDGSMGVIPEEWLARYGTLLAVGSHAHGQLRFRRSQTALLDALLSEHVDEVELDVDAAFEQARSELADLTRLEPRSEPESFRGTLRPYQREGLGWFAWLRRYGFGGCLADDMGLGKTIMVLALLDDRRKDQGDTRRPSLIVVPRSLVGNWMAEAARFAPALRIVDHSHVARDQQAQALADADAVIVTYGTLRRDISELSAIEFDYAVLDEAQTIKNASTVSAKATRLIRAQHALALSGTPIENHLGELWSLFEFLNPGILGRSTVFHRAVTAADGDATRLLSRGLRPFVLRRTKQQVAQELPARTEQTLVCELLPKDRRLYDRLLTHYRTTVLAEVARSSVSRSHMHVLEALLRLRQASCHPGLIDPQRASDDSAKFDVLIPRLREVVEEGHKALVFSQFTSLLALLKPRLDEEKIRYEYLDGSTRDRAARVDRFQTDPEVPVFLISLKAGGLGLNLTAADYVFLLDPWWNPAVEAQAIDRAHRIGQTREVFAYRLIAKDTVEEKVLQLQQSKRALADAVLEADGGGLRTLSREDLELLLS